MQVRVNDSLIHLFAGARVRDAVLHYSREIFEFVASGAQHVYNIEGKRLPLYARVHDGQILLVKNGNGGKP